MNFGEDMERICGHWARDPADIVGAAVAFGLIVLGTCEAFSKLAEIWS